MRFECASRTHVGLRRKINEDSILADCERGLFVVADGMGGHDAGEVASAMATDALRCLPHVHDLNVFSSDAVDALRAVNRELLELAQSGGEARGKTIGTTIVGVIIVDNGFSCFWMGDSRAYRLRGEELTRLSHDHSVVQNLVDAGLLKAEDADSHENANLVTRAVGVDEKFEIEIVSGTIEAGDQFLIASDGLTRVVQDKELLDELKRSTPDEAADNLIETVIARGAPDNVSLIIVKLG